MVWVRGRWETSIVRDGVDSWGAQMGRRVGKGGEG